jgi:hypothetical protein
MRPWTHSFTVAALVAGLAPIAVAAQGAPTPVGGEVMFVSGVAERMSQDGRRQNVTKGLQLLEGDRVRTNGESHVYVRMRDGGLLVVRPASELHIDVWRYDPAQPQESRIRYTLDNGVARHVSGIAAKAARDKFRFNTPMAAIGVRGTDFTVLADPQVTRIAVQSGGVIVNALGNGCRVDGLGPCEGGSAVELFATARDKLLQLRMGERRVELVDAVPGSAPDTARPPATGEPTASRKSAVEVDIAQARVSEIVQQAQAEKSKGEQLPPVVVAPPPVVVVPEPPVVVAPPPVVVPELPAAVWGRWAAIADKDPGVVSAEDVLKGRSIVAINPFYILAANKPTTPFEMPGAGIGNFVLSGHDGVIMDKQTGQNLASTASDGSLRIDFGARRFDTSLNIAAGTLSAQIKGQGTVEKDGKFNSEPFSSQSIIQGIVGGKDAGQALYLYQRSIDSRYGATGAASWVR